MKTRIKKTSLALIFIFLMIGMFPSFLLNYNRTNFVAADKNIESKSNLNTHDLSSNNLYSGIGAPWNVTHYANRTDSDLGVAFNEGGSDGASIPLGSGWKGYKLEVSTNDLKDNRNWNNGTFSYGADNGYIDGANDSSWIQNNYQNWTFGENDTGAGVNVMSGNYLSNIGGQDCLELRMDDYITNIGGTLFSSYDPNDSCWWGSAINVPRGRVIDSRLNFELYPSHLAGFNSWAFSIYLNSKKVYQIGTFTLLNFGANAWHSFSIPQDVWINNTNVFPSGSISSSDIKIQLVLECIGGGNYSGFTNDDYQQFYVDNVGLEMECEALPSDLGLTVNGTAIQNIALGKGKATLSGDWESSTVLANFATNDVGELGPYSVSFDTTLNLYAEKTNPDTSFETNTGSLGTYFEVGNSSTVSWEAFSYIAVPTGYIESQMIVRFPDDINIISIFTSVEPTVNVLTQCDSSSSGILIVPVNAITGTPDGFWKLNGESPNYCEELAMYSNSTGQWEQNDVFLSGDSINITANINPNSIILDHIQNTKALLQIRFPDGSMWNEEKQFAFVDINGDIKFNPIQIPTTPPNYEVGIYQAIVSWNNSYSGLGLNESGLIFKTFQVVHESSLIPEKSFFGNTIEGTVLNLKVSFSDKENFDAIENAVIYTYNFTQPSVRQYFSEVNPGSYLLEFNTIGGKAGNNTLTIYANSSSYVNNAINITVDLIKQTTLTVNTTFLQNVPYESNFSIQFNYTETYGGAGISADSMTSDWAGDHQFITQSNGVYQLISNASGPGITPGNLYTFILKVQANKYIPQSIPIRVFINQLESRLELYINGTRYYGNELISFEIWQKINVTARYVDSNGAFLSGASLKLTIGSYTDTLNEDIANQQYSAMVNASDLGLSLDYLTIIANKTFYNPESVRVIVEITERLTSLQIFIDGLNRTIDPTVTVPIGAFVNLTIIYLDSGGSHIGGANLKLLGDYSAPLIENSSLKQYSLIINSTELGIGIKIITISAQKANYQFQTKDLRLEIRKISTEIALQGEEPRISILPGQDVTLNVVLTDLDFGGRILGAEVVYTWSGGSGVLTDPDNNGVYTATLRNVPAGSYTIRINAFKGENYDFNTFEIALSAIVPAENLVIYLIAIISAIAVGSALIIYYYLYRTIFRFPRQVRHVKKYRKTLDKASNPRVDISKRDDAFHNAYKDEVSAANKLHKAKVQTTPKMIDKLAEKQQSDVSGEETNP